ncbi:MAG TPA: hypothetical protein VFA26_14310, partial [Gemmataceae bacterium]|nr:hypothetical protein [Gemmataceae bacterium]
KARGVGQLLHQLETELETASPPDLAEVAGRTRSVWEKTLGEEAQAAADVLLATLEPFQREIEHHFALEGQRRFRGPMAVYLKLFTRAKYATNSLRDRIPFLPRPASDEPKAPTTWDLSAFTSACSAAAFSRHLDARGRALSNRLLLDADQQGYPLDLLAGPTEAAGKIDWRQRYSAILVEVLDQVEKEWAKPVGVRRWVQATILFLADWLPAVALLAACTRVLWLYFMREPSDPKLELIDFLLPAIVVLVVLVILHVLIALLLPLRWATIRGEFQRRLRARLQTELLNVYAPVPGDVAEVMRNERQQVEHLRNEARQVTAWLNQREQAASINSLYGG